MSAVFVSHASSDGALMASELVRVLEAAGHRCWVAPRDIEAGKTYPAQIMAAIRACAGLVVLATPAANRSGDVLQEVQIAHSHNKLIVPVLAGDDPPSDDLAYFLSVRHQIRWSTAAEVVQAILRTLPASSGMGSSAGGASAAMTPGEAIARAAAAESGVTGSFAMTVVSTGSEGDIGWLMSEADYRDPRCLSIALDANALRELARRLGADPLEVLKGESIVVAGVARKQRIDFLRGGKPTGHYYFQTHVQVGDAAQVTVMRRT
ncbi:MAG: toll/interleukin-1 receptor domain-containing protein [Hyphomicrobiaceae bacterium]